MLHVKHSVIFFGPVLLSAAFLGGCPRTSTPRNPPEARREDGSAQHPSPVRDGSLATPQVPTPPPVPSPSAERIDWAEAYPPTDLSADRVSQLQSIAQSREGAIAEHAAFVLGRRAPATTLTGIASVLPQRLAGAFARGACGRSADQQPATLPPIVLAALQTDPVESGIAAWVTRSRRDLTGLPPARARWLLASHRFDDQLTGARLLSASSIEVTPELIEALPPVALPAAFRSVSLRPTQTPVWWRRWIEVLALRTSANARAWGNAWRSLLDYAPKQVPEVRAALTTGFASLANVRTGDEGVDAAFRCSNAQFLDTINAQLSAVPQCATGVHRWRALVAQIGYAKDTTTDASRFAHLQTALNGAEGDARVLEAAAEASVQFPPAVARPILTQLAASRDPGVLAAFLEALVLHVQHARSLPERTRDELIAAPFALPEAASIEARLQAVQLARVLGRPLPQVLNTTRAMQQAMQPDASVVPYESPAFAPSTLGELTVTTRHGRIVIRVHGETAPRAAEIVIQAALGGRYNNTIFHRVVPGFVAQGGDPRGDGYGGTTTITPTELSGARFARGAVGIALAGLDTGGMQFFIMTADSPHLDARYPHIGEVIEGMDVADELMVGDVIERVAWTPVAARAGGAQN